MGRTSIKFGTYSDMFVRYFILLILMTGAMFAQEEDEALFHEGTDKIVIKKPKNKSKRTQKQPESYSGDTLVQLVVLHIFANRAESYEPEFMELRLKTLIQLMKVQGVTTESDIDNILIPDYMAHVLPCARSKNSLAPSLLLTKENLKRLEYEQGHEFTEAFKTYVKALKKASENDSPKRRKALTQHEMYSILPVVIEGYYDLSPAYVAAQEPEEVHYIQSVLERFAAYIYLLELDGSEIPPAARRAFYRPCHQAGPEQLQKTLREAVEYNGLPRSIRSLNLKKAAKQWHLQIQALDIAN